MDQLPLAARGRHITKSLHEAQAGVSEASADDALALLTFFATCHLYPRLVMSSTGVWQACARASSKLKLSKERLARFPIDTCLFVAEITGTATLVQKLWKPTPTNIEVPVRAVFLRDRVHVSTQACDCLWTNCMHLATLQSVHVQIFTVQELASSQHG